MIALGDKKFKIDGVIAAEPDRARGFLGFAPRVMMAASDLPATNLIQDGSRATYRFLLAETSQRLENFKVS